MSVEARIYPAEQLSRRVIDLATAGRLASFGQQIFNHAGLRNFELVEFERGPNFWEKPADYSVEAVINTGDFGKISVRETGSIGKYSMGGIFIDGIDDIPGPVSVRAIRVGPRDIKNFSIGWQEGTKQKSYTMLAYSGYTNKLILHKSDEWVEIANREYDLAILKALGLDEQAIDDISNKAGSDSPLVEYEQMSPRVISAVDEILLLVSGSQLSDEQRNELKRNQSLSRVKTQEIICASQEVGRRLGERPTASPKAIEGCISAAYSALKAIS